MTPQLHDNLIRTFRRRLGLSLEDLAKLLGHRTASSATRHEGGLRKPSLDALLYLFHVLGVPPHVLYPRRSQEIAEEVRKNAERLLLTLPTDSTCPLIRAKRLSAIRIIARLGPKLSSYDPLPPPQPLPA